MAGAEQASASWHINVILGNKLDTEGVIMKFRATCRRSVSFFMRLAAPVPRPSCLAGAPLA